MKKAAKAELAPRPRVLCENSLKREECVKHFLLEDGSHMAAVYDIPVHHMVDGVWTDFDNSFVPHENFKAVKAYVNKNSHLRVQLKEQLSGEFTNALEYMGYSIHWKYQGTALSTLELPDKATKDLKASPEILTKLKGQATYRNIFPKVNAVYISSPIGLNENLVLTHPQAPTSFIAQYTLEGLHVLQANPQQLSLRNGSDEEIFTINVPQARDAAGAVTVSTAIELLDKQDEGFTAQITVNQAWVSAPERVFPITIDPGFITNQKYAGIDTAWIASGKPATALGRITEEMALGLEMDGYGKARILAKMRTLPALTPGDVIVDASLNLVQCDCLHPMVFYAYQLTADWSAATVTWNSKIPNASTRLDVETAGGFYEDLVVRTWNITKLARDWYQGKEKNYGILLTSPSENGSKIDRALFCSSVSSAASARPVFSINYRHTFGLESYWSYHSQSFSSGVSAHINDSTGNLVVTAPLADSFGCRLPGELSLTYNSNASDTLFRKGVTSHTSGLGWIASTNCRIDTVDKLPFMSAEVAKALKAQGYVYAFTDSDGTIHYLKKASATEHQDEDGMDLTMSLAADTGYYQLRSKDGAMMEFFTTGKLRRQTDNMGNTMWWQYDGAKLIKIADGAGKIITVNSAPVADYSQITGATDPSGRSAVISYKGSCISAIKNTDGLVTTFEYTATTINGRSYQLLTKIIDHDKSFVRYVYETGASDCFKARVTEVHEFGTDGTPGKVLKIIYNDDNSSSFQLISNGKTLTETYQYDAMGRTKCVRHPNGSASLYDYTNKKTTTDAKRGNNKIASSALGYRQINNLLVNTLAEKDTKGWVLSGIAQKPAADFSILGANCLTGTLTTAKTIYACQSVKVVAGHVYTGSAYFSTSGVSSTQGGACAWIEYYKDSTLLSTTVGAALTGTLKKRRLSCTAKAPAEATLAKVYFGLRDSTGTVYMDAFQLESCATTNDFNPLQNSCFNAVAGWQTGGSPSAGDGVLCNGTARLTGIYNKEALLFQDVPVGKAGVNFKISARAKASSIPLNDPKDLRRCAVELIIYYTDKCVDCQTFQFNDFTRDWQYMYGVAGPTEANKKKVIERVRFQLSYNHNCNLAYFSQAMLAVDTSGTAFAYDKQGNLITAKDNAKRNSAATFSTANELTKFTNSKNESYTYVYDKANAHKLTAARSSQLGNGFTYGYDKGGNITSTAMGTVAADGTLSTTAPKLVVSAAYNARLDSLVSITDQTGAITTFTVDDKTGLRKSAKSPNGAVSTYTYDAGSQLLTKVSSGTASVAYSYKNINQITGIAHNGFTYDFSYDAFSNLTGIKVAGHPLSSYVYSKDGGSLLSASCGASGKLDYAYDAYDRLTTINLNGKAWFSQEYDEKGNIGRAHDFVNSRTIGYHYDLNDRLEAVYCGKIYSSQYLYDSFNRISGVVYSFGGQSKRASYAYGKDGLKGTATLFSGTKHSCSYDTLNRITASATGPLSQSIAYVNVSGQQTTLLPKTINHLVAGKSILSLSYEYDKMGNIVRRGNAAYTYDSMGQLSSFKDSSEKLFEKYSYDAGGNLSAVTVCDYSTGATKSQVLYKYDTAWKDLLINLGGKGIVYDLGGNPQSYLGNTLKWTLRRLDSVTKTDGTRADYAYDTQGQRISKTVGKVKTDYYYDSGRLISQKTGSTQLWFEYDSDGQLIGFLNGSAEYLYLRNAQNDILGLTDKAGKLLATYSYDPWGKLLSVKNAAGQSIVAPTDPALLNPLRYRSYLYDAETGFYQLKSRYYDPIARRFISPDEPQLSAATPEMPQWDKNLFAYCDNDPVSRTDAAGDFWLAAVAIAAGIGAAVSFVTDVVSQKITTGEVDWTQAVVAAGTGALSGACSMIPGVGPIKAIVLDAAIGGASSATSQLIQRGSIDLNETMNAVCFSALGSVMSNPVPRLNLTKKEFWKVKANFEKGKRKIKRPSASTQKRGRQIINDAYDTRYRYTAGSIASNTVSTTVSTSLNARANMSSKPRLDSNSISALTPEERMRYLMSFN